MSGLPSLGWVDVLGLALLHFLWQGALVGALLLAADVFIKEARAQYRVACLALLLMAACPVVTVWHLSGDASPQSASAAHTADTRGRPQAVSHPAAPLLKRSGSTYTLFADATATKDFLLEPSLPPTLPSWVVTLWGLGVCLSLVKLFVGWLETKRLRTRTSSPPPALAGHLRVLSHHLKLARPVLLRVSTHIDTPMVVGVLRPVILLPASVLTGLSPHYLEAVLLHELAHVRRRDTLVNLLQVGVRALLFYHPVVWWVSGRIHVAREHLCDDLVVQVCRDPVGYARALGRLEELRAARPALAQCATGGSSLGRIERLLGRADPRTRLFLPSLASLLTTLLLVAAGAFATLTLAQQPGTLQRLLADPLLSQALSQEELVNTLGEVMALDDAQKKALLVAVAPTLPADLAVITAYAEVADTLPEAARREAIAALTGASSGESGAGPNNTDNYRRVVAAPTGASDGRSGAGTRRVGPSDTVNYRSVGVRARPLLPPGFELGVAGLRREGRGRFPKGRQFVYTTPLLPPVSEEPALERLRRVVSDGTGDDVSGGERVHVVLTRYEAEGANQPDPRLTFDFTLLQQDEQYPLLGGPWTLWIDTTDLIRRATVSPENRRDLYAAPSFYACVEDGRVVASYDDYLLNLSPARLQAVIRACLDDALAPETVLTYGYGGDAPAPDFVLADEAGNTLSPDALRGRPFALLALQPRADPPAELAEGEHLLEAVKPGPEETLERVQALLGGGDPAVPVYVLALPYDDGTTLWSADAVAPALRDELPVPVYEDAAGTFVDVFSQYLPFQAPLLLFDAQGGIIDAFVDLASGVNALPEQGAPLTAFIGGVSGRSE